MRRSSRVGVGLDTQQVNNVEQNESVNHCKASICPLGGAYATQLSLGSHRITPAKSITFSQLIATLTQPKVALTAGAIALLRGDLHDRECRSSCWLLRRCAALEVQEQAPPISRTRHPTKALVAYVQRILHSRTKPRDTPIGSNLRFATVDEDYEIVFGPVNVLHQISGIPASLQLQGVQK